MDLEGKPWGILAICGALVFAAICFVFNEAQKRGWLSSSPPKPPPVYFLRTNESAQEVPPIPEPLHEFDGVRRKPIYLAVKGRVFDVSTGEDFYGPNGGGYRALAGQDASRALGIMSLQGKEFWEEDCRIRRIDDLTEKQYKVMREWEEKFMEKYPIVGELIGRSGTVGGIDFVPAEGKEALEAAATAKPDNGSHPDCKLKAQQDNIQSKKMN